MPGHPIKQKPPGDPDVPGRDPVEGESRPVALRIDDTLIATGPLSLVVFPSITGPRRKRSAGRLFW